MAATLSGKWALRRPDGEKISGEIMLWCATVEQAVRDAQRARGTGKGEVLAARSWLASWLCVDALLICGVEPDYWFRRVVPALRARWLAADAAGRRTRQLSPEALASQAAALRRWHVERHHQVAA